MTKSVIDESGRYNKWTHKRPLVVEDESIESAFRFAWKFRTNRAAMSATVVHKLVGCAGFEFVAFSNAVVSRPMRLCGDVALWPCFPNDVNGMNLGDPLVAALFKMQRTQRYLYDGWVPICDWSSDGVLDAIRQVENALSLLCLNNPIWIEWEPKYPVINSASRFAFYEPSIDWVETVGGVIDRLNDDDQEALLASIGWLGQSVAHNVPSPARLLYAVFAVESLASYIEREASDDSPLRKLRVIPSLLKAERRLREEECIRHILKSEAGLSAAIRKAYSDCIGAIGSVVKSNVMSVVGANFPGLKAMFDGKESIYGMRNKIAHGDLNSLRTADLDQMHRNADVAYLIARQYLREVLRKAVGIIMLDDGAAMSWGSVGAIDMLGGAEYCGPTLMAILYVLS